MSVTASVNQIKFSGKGNLDPKMNAVATLSELFSAIPRKERKEGMSVVVLNNDGDGVAQEYWLIGGTADANWVKKADGDEYFSGNDVE